MSNESLEDLVQRLQGGQNGGGNKPSFDDRSVSEGTDFRSEYVEKEQDRFRSELILHNLTIEKANKILKRRK
jgi:hypothetical protein